MLECRFEPCSFESPHFAKPLPDARRRLRSFRDSPSRYCFCSDETDKQSLYVRFSLSDNFTTLLLELRHDADDRPSDGNYSETRRRYRGRRRKGTLPRSVPFFGYLRCFLHVHNPMGASSKSSAQSIERFRYSQGGNDRARFKKKKRKKRQSPIPIRVT